MGSSNYRLTGVLGNDAVSLNNPSAGSYDNANAGTGKTVSVEGLELLNNSLGNYVLASGGISGSIGVITPATVTATLTGTVSKVYDTTAGASLGSGNYRLTGVLGTTR